MPSLSKNLSKINISLQYDAITIYPIMSTRCKDGQTLSESSNMTLFLKACDKAGFVMENNKKLYNCIDNIEKVPEFDRLIHNDDADHSLYHQDKFDSAETHFHLKCNSLLNHKKLAELLEIAKTYELITESEKIEIFSDFDKKYKIDMQTMVASLIKNKTEQDAIKDIHAYINKCYDLNTLIYLHQELLESQYSFLRANIDGSSSWRGMIAQDGTMGNCSETWAKIEKSLELQMVHILDTICPNLTPDMGAARATELRFDNPFFGRKHHVADVKEDDQDEGQDNSVYSTLQAGYAYVLKEKYARHFEKMLAVRSTEKPLQEDKQNNALCDKQKENMPSLQVNVGFFRRKILPLLDSDVIFNRFTHLNFTFKPKMVI